MYGAFPPERETAVIRCVLISANSKGSFGVHLPSYGVFVNDQDARASGFRTTRFQEIPPGRTRPAVTICAELQDFLPQQEDSGNAFLDRASYLQKKDDFKLLKRMFKLGAEWFWHDNDIHGVKLELPQEVSFAFNRSRRMNQVVCEILGIPAAGRKAIRANIDHWSKLVKERKARTQPKEKPKPKSKPSEPKPNTKKKREMPSSMPLCLHNNQMYYKVLGLQYGASPDEIRKSYLKKALRYHTDRVIQREGEAIENFEKRLQAAKNMMQLLNNAHEALVKDLQ